MAALAVTSVAWGAADATDAPQPLELSGEGSWGAYQEVVSWQNALIGAPSPIDLNYVRKGTQIARGDFLDGNADFVLSGAPFTSDEIAKLPNKDAGKDLISAPVQVSTLAFLLNEPLPDAFTVVHLVCDPDDPNVPDPDACIQRLPYTGPIRVPDRNLAAMIVRYGGGDGAIPWKSWNNPAVLEAFGITAPDSLTTSPLAGPASALRSDPDELNLFLQQYVKTAAPDVWDALKAADTHVQWEPIAERIPRLSASSREGVEQQVLQIGPGGDPASGSLSNSSAGVFAPAPPSARATVLQTYPDAKLAFISIKNANGDWVEPTPTSINAAIDAGGDTPLYALSNKVPDAYPLTWVDRLYVPASGLSVEKTEGLATVIRYLAVAGQDVAQTVGEGRLSKDLVSEALAAADKVVDSNCTGKDREKVKNSDPGVYAPKVDAMKTIGPMLHCVSTATPTTTIPTVPPTNFQVPVSVGGLSSTLLPSSGLQGASLPVNSAATPATEPKSAKSISTFLTASKLPLPDPGSNRGPDPISTVVLGAGGFLLMQGPSERLVKRLLR